MSENNYNVLLNEINEVLEKTKDFSMINDAEFDVQYPTGFLSFDYRACGKKIKVNCSDGNTFSYDSIGIVDGSLNMFIGRSGCGKSTFVVQTASNIVRPFENGLIFADFTEAGMMKDRFESLSGFTPEEFTNKVKIRNSGINIENVYKRIKVIHDIKLSNTDKYRYDTGVYDTYGNKIYKFQPTVYIIDSIPNLTTEKIAEEDDMSGQMSTTANAKALAQLYRRITQICKEANIILMAINHITEKIEPNAFIHTKAKLPYLKQNESLPGGTTPPYLSTVFRLDDGSKITSDKEFGIEGCYVSVSNVKSRAGMSGAVSAVDLVFNYVIGFDPDLSLFIMLKNAGKVNGAGAYLYFGDRNDHKFSQKNFKEKLATDPELLDIFVNEAFNYLRGELDIYEKLKSASVSKSTSLIMDRIKNMNNIN